jgi:cytochrome c553
MPKDEMIRKVKDFRSGAKPATVMQQLSKGYTDQQIEMIANYYAAQK